MRACTTLAVRDGFATLTGRDDQAASGFCGLAVVGRSSFGEFAG
jgi:hypothetical protein